MSYKSEFPDYDGEFHMIDGWIDNSWHNDTCPNIMRRYVKGNTTLEFRIWQDYADINNREYDNTKRYMFHIYVDNDVVFYSESNDWSDMEKLAKGVDVYGWQKEI